MVSVKAFLRSWDHNGLSCLMVLLPSRTFAWSLCQIKKVNKKIKQFCKSTEKNLLEPTEWALVPHLPTHLFRNETIMELHSSATAQSPSPKHVTTNNLWQTIQSLPWLVHLDPVAHFQTAAVMPGRFSEGTLASARGTAGAIHFTCETEVTMPFINITKFSGKCDSGLTRLNRKCAWFSVEMARSG